MADNDKFLKSIGACWKKSYEAAHGYGNARDVAELCVEGLRSVLQNTGFPEFNNFHALLAPFCVKNEQPSLFKADTAEAVAQCAYLSACHAGCGMTSVLAHIGARVVQRLLLQVQMAGPLRGDPGEIFATKLLPEIARALCIDRFQSSDKVIERFLAKNQGNIGKSTDAMYDFLDEACSYLEQVCAPLASQLASDPTGRSLPKRLKKSFKRSTADLTSEVIG